MTDATPGNGIEIDSLSVRYGSQATILQGLSLRIAAGEIVAIVGASGGGKSTLLRAIAGLLPISSGSIEFSGSAKRRDDIAYVFQDATLLPWRTVQQNVHLPFELGRRQVRRRQDMTAAEARAKVDQAISQVGLDAAAAVRFPHQLSGGMQMRASLARAIVTDPQILLLDEPFGALDDLLRSRMNDLLLQLHAARQRTILFVTHNIAEAVFLSHRIVVLGKKAVGEVIDNALTFPRTPEVRSSLEFAQLYGQVSGALARVGS